MGEAWTGYAAIMEDLVTAVLIAVGLEAVFFTLLMVMGRLEPEETQETDQVEARITSASQAPPPRAPQEDEQRRAA
jgi:hypothetical protein